MSIADAWTSIEVSHAHGGLLAIATHAIATRAIAAVVAGAAVILLVLMVTSLRSW